MDLLKQYEEFEGIDCNLGIALYDYGMIWGTNEHCTENQKMFVYCVHGQEEASHKQLFGFAYMSVDDIKELLQEGWFEFDAFKSYMGLDKSLAEILETYSNNSFFELVYSMVQYYGYENILGSAYSSFPIYETDDFLTRIRYEVLQRGDDVDMEEVEEYLEEIQRVNYDKLEGMTRIDKNELKELR